ncbi:MULTISPECIES: methylated-DNA--[protein]-cysteine S-methyltransferase [Exiguobacterium]|uniref:methylated-DNA--[protein]-cysteine S-methyltransferase n=1 Tax=Exiguobacterium TaxID=33986 RepID=UPI0008779B6B|nr:MULTISPECIES: MGMT family protein [Exiguobacterium]OGX78460.1 cysteine methyltransferase [Exiguobacterium sp. SH31]TCI33683.1 MGMT family protein [Exiguobacterium sp. SH4S7]TCI43315.1 MGMT family protein [Exiguobacterium sp. SH5S32]TCI50036.1 MGMT family protein [Exiguobacterium sp. SH1S4]TCI65953.1 MGMT family protein [Exiguobacterium sp. SH0S2]
MSSKWGTLSYELNEQGKLIALDFAETEQADGSAPVWLVDMIERVEREGLQEIDRVWIDMNGTVFQQEVWDALLTIPSGETRTYKQIAEQIGRPKAVRAVGQALNRNPLPVIFPCHRVVGSSGQLTGFAGGLDQKQRLLDIEQVK